MRRCGCSCKIRHTHIHARTKTNSRKKRNSLFVKEITGEKKARATLPLLCTHSQYVLSTGCVWCEATNTIRDTTTMHNAIHDVSCDTQQLWKEFWASDDDDDNNRQLHANKNDNNKQSFSSTPHEKCKKAEEEELPATLAATYTKCDEIKNTYYEVMVDAARRSPQQRRHSQ